MHQRLHGFLCWRRPGCVRSQQRDCPFWHRRCAGGPGRWRPRAVFPEVRMLGTRKILSGMPSPITGKEHAKPNLPTHVIVNDCEYLEKDSIILLEQIRTLDKQRLQEYIGTFDRRFMISVNKALAISIGISKKD